MSSGACGSDGSGKQPASSIRDAFSSLFSRDRSDSADGPAVLTAFRELPEGEDPLPDARGSKEGGQPSNNASEPELVQVTRVETYSDTENEEEEASRRRRDEGELRDEGDGACEVPVFRTHKLDPSCIENMLHAEKSRRKTRSSPAGADSYGVSEGTETPRTEGPAEREEHAAVDCSRPVPSVLSGPAGSDAAAASPSEHLEGTEKGERKEGTAGSPGGPEAPSPDERSVDRPASVGDHQPESQQSAAPTTPETNTQPWDSPVSSTRGSTPPSPPSFHMPALFSGLRVLKKGGVGGDRDTTAEIKQREKDADLALLSLKKPVNKAKLHSEQKTPSPTRTQPAGGKTAAPGQPTHTSAHRQDADTNGRKASEGGDDIPGEKSPGAAEKRSTSDQAYETFRSIFGPRAAKKDKTDEVDLEAVKRKIKSDKENLKSIFARVSRTPSKELKSPTETKVRVPPSVVVVLVGSVSMRCPFPPAGRGHVAHGQRGPDAGPPAGRVASTQTQR